MDHPDYSYPRGLFAALVRDVLLLRRRSFRKDAKACIEKLDPPLQVLGKENIPQHGRCVVTMNHYHRAGFGAQWIALAIAASVPADMHWMMTGEFTSLAVSSTPLTEFVPTTLTAGIANLFSLAYW